MIAPAICTNEGCERTYRPDKRRQTTLCKRCASTQSARNPERRARVSAGMRKAFQEPEKRAAMLEKMRKLRKANMANPVWRAKSEENGRRIGLANGGTVAGSPSRVAFGRRRTEMRLGHIPLEYRDEYRRLQSKTRLSPKEISALILELVEADQRRYLATGDMPQAKRARS